MFVIQKEQKNIILLKIVEACLIANTTLLKKVKLMHKNLDSHFVVGKIDSILA